MPILFEYSAWFKFCIFMPKEGIVVRYFVLFLLALQNPLCSAEIVSSKVIEGFVERTSGFKNKAKSEQDISLKELKELLQSAASVKAFNAFRNFLNEQWDPKLSPTEKDLLIEKAKKAAEEAARQFILSVASEKSSNGKTLTMNQALNRAMATVSNNDSYWEHTKFIDPNGKINLKSRLFHPTSITPEEERPDVNLVQWADSAYNSTPEERARYVAEMQRSIAEQVRTNESKNVSPQTHSATPGACGTSSTDAATLRPETNGMR